VAVPPDSPHASAQPDAAAFKKGRHRGLPLRAAEISPAWWPAGLHGQRRRAAKAWMVGIAVALCRKPEWIWAARTRSVPECRGRPLCLPIRIAPAAVEAWINLGSPARLRSGM
jgi:hypothetical protein